VTTTPDPKTVREIAQKHIHDDVNDVGLTIQDHIGIDAVLAMDKHAYGALCSAVREAVRTGTLAWPDEQPQDDGDVRAVAALAAADDDEQLDRAISELIARFAVRIAALEARDTADGGAE
jgi:hypothetical protein